MQWKCPYCDKELTEDDIMRSSCPNCKKVIDISQIKTISEKEPEEPKKEATIQSTISTFWDWLIAPGDSNRINWNRITRFFLSLIIISFIFTTCMTYLTKENTTPSQTLKVKAPVDKAILENKKPETLPAYRITDPKAYGAPGIKVGNKYWINAPIGTSEDVIRRIVEKETQSRKDEKVLMGNRLFTSTEITFFVYNKLSEITKKEKVPGEEIADFVYEWSPSKGLVLTDTF